ncbi:MAG TPA: acyl-CoA dehydrogenase family protein [Methylomirabilota bacterium]|jgi:alkylation response protein AidB-like acyl-CoA dehydrogenase|nr:acyl-CoA dehydrogenase family protein [Methylomirabilota bacterium]
MSDERFKAIGMDDMTMPGGWSVSDGQTFLYTAAERELMLQARAFAQKEILPHAAGAHQQVTQIKAGFQGKERRARLRPIAQRYLRTLAEAGMTGALFPEEYGGNGRGVVAECIVDEELAAAGHPGDTIRSVSLTLGTISILRYGTAEQKRRHIPPRLRGEELAALAITEPQIGSDTARMETRATLKGDRWVINGQKRFITGGGLADYLTLFAMTETGVHPHKGMSTFIVPMDHPGVTIRRQMDEVIMADWMDNAWIDFNDVDIPKENLLGPLNGGYHVLMDELDTERVTYCMAALGSARRALEVAAEYATKRVQFKQPIAMFEGVSFKLAEMYAALDAARQVIYRTAKMVEAGVPAQRESAVTKLFVAEAVWRIVDHAMQVLGGIGYTTDFPIQAIFRNARLLRIGAGSDEIMKFLIAREVLREIKG